jgi:hypothetical protein
VIPLLGLRRVTSLIHTLTSSRALLGGGIRLPTPEAPGVRIPHGLWSFAKQNSKVKSPKDF